MVIGSGIWVRVLEREGQVIVGDGDHFLLLVAAYGLVEWFMVETTLMLLTGL